MMTGKKTVGYIRCFSSSEPASNMQKFLIEAYCMAHQMKCDKIYYDIGYQKDRHADERWKAEKIGINSCKDRATFPAWDDLMLSIISGEVECILVDFKLRLYNGVEQKEVVEQLCKEYDVTIREVSNSDTPPESSISTRVVVYHFSDNPESRTSVVLNDIDQIYEYASHQLGWEVVEVFMDKSLTNRTQFEVLMEKSDYNVLLVKSFYHIKRKMMPFLSAAKELKQKNIRIVSVEEGEFVNIVDEADVWLDKPLRIAVYDKCRSQYERENQNIQMQKFDTFVRVKTLGGHIEGIYVDENEQEHLQELIHKSDEYDIILIDTFGKIGDTVIALAKVMNQINIPIYSLREGGIELHEV
jgi:hypothetical protein